MTEIWRYLHEGWERLLFGCVGAACLVFTFAFLWHAEVPAASAVFAMSVFSFFYSNLARFKRFKGLGFEAELWEDKQKEAEHLIERLKRVVTVYTREIVMNNVMRGRWGGAEEWQKRWGLLDELENRHIELGQDIDFSDLKRDVESVFIFDLCSPLLSSVRQSISAAKTKAREAGSARFGNPVKDINGYREFHEKLRAIGEKDEDLFERSKSENIAASILMTARNAQDRLREDFSIELHFRDGLIQRLEFFSNLFENRPIPLTKELMAWADDHDAFR